MIKPLAIVFHETLLPGSRLANRLTDLGWRVLTLGVAANVLDSVRKETPMVVILELALRNGDSCGLIAEMKRDSTIAHIPVIGYTAGNNKRLQDAAVGAGARLVAADTAILDQLPQLLEYALAIE